MKRLLIAILLVSLLLFAGCAKDKGASGGDSKMNVVATTTMLHDLVKVIGGDKVTTEGLMGPGVDPHLYSATAGDVDKLSKANLVIYNGLHLEAQLGEVLKNIEGKDIKTVPVGEAVPEKDRLPFDQSQFDPHIWFDVNNWKLVTVATKDAMVEADPANKDTYEKNCENYLKELDELDKYVRDKAAEVPEKSRVLVTAHDAFNYFGRAYGFEVKGLQGISTESEVGTGDVKEIADFIVERQIKAIFVESSVPQKNIKAVQEAVKAQGFDVKIGGELYSDSLGSAGEDAETYIGTIKANINTIVDALK